MTNIELGSNVSLDYDDIGNVKRINIKDESFIPIDSEIAHEILKTNRCLYYIYLILDETTNMFYIGKQSINRPALKKRIDCYFGSGIIINRMYCSGNHNLVKFILKCCKNKFILADLEAKIVDDELRTNKNCMNLCNGGIGGKTLSDEGYKKLGLKHKQWFIDNRDKELIRIEKLKTYLNSEIGKCRQSESHKKYYDTHTEMKEHLRQKALEQFSDPIRKQRFIDGCKKFLKEHPECREKQREMRLKYNEAHKELEKERMGKLNEFMKLHPEKYLTNARIVIMMDKQFNIIQEFRSIGMAAEYIIKNKLSSGKKGTIMGNIYKGIKKNYICFGYRWKYKTLDKPCGL